MYPAAAAYPAQQSCPGNRSQNTFSEASRLTGGSRRCFAKATTDLLLLLQKQTHKPCVALWFRVTQEAVEQKAAGFRKGSQVIPPQRKCFPPPQNVMLGFVLTSSRPLGSASDRYTPGCRWKKASHLWGTPEPPLLNLCTAQTCKCSGGSNKWGLLLQGTGCQRGTGQFFFGGGES